MCNNQTIPTACYYIIKLVRDKDKDKISYAHIYDRDASLLKSVKLEEDEVYAENFKRIDGMLDYNSVNKLHPGKFVIDNDSVVGLVQMLHIYDKNNKLVRSQKYNGPTTLTGLVTHQKNNNYAIAVDYDWALANNTVVVNNYMEKTCLLNCISMFKWFGCM